MEKKGYKLGYLELPTDKLIKANWNYKTENAEKQEKLKQNIKKNGQIENIIVREINNEQFEVVNGNHRLTVLNDLNIKKVFCYNLGKINKANAIRIAIETNETKFESDNIELAERIKEISKTFNDLEITLPYTKEEIENFKTLTDFSWDQFDKEPIDTLDDTEFDKTINFKVTNETYKRWLELKQKMKEINGYSTDSKVFEFAIIETLNIPFESYQ